VRQLFQLPSGHDEGHPVEALLQIVLARIRLVIDQLILILIAVLVHLGDDLESLGVFQIEEKIHRLPATPHRHRLTTDDG
jgi:hypothetical protein